MEIELSNGQLRLWQWDTGQKVRVPENVPTVHFKWGSDAVSFDVVDGWVEIPPELTQKAGYILLWTYREDHTLDAARIPVERRPKPDGYAYTPTEIKTWEQLDKRITALEKGGGVAAVTSVNGKTGAVELTAEDVGAATEEYVDNNSKLFVINITDSLNGSNDKVYSADKTYSEILGALNNGLLPVCKMPKHTTGRYVYGLCYFSGKLTPPIGNDSIFFRSLDIDTLNSKRTVVSIYPNNDVVVASEPVVMTGATDSRSGIPGYVPVPQSSERNYFLRGDAKWEPALQPPAIASVGEYLSVKTVDNNGIVTETEAVDAPRAGDLSLGLTGATVGQTVKISAVDANGVPTAWEPVDMASGGGTWEKLYDGTMQIEQETMSIEVDMPRNDSAKGFQIYLHFSKNVAQEWAAAKAINVQINGAPCGYFTFENKLVSDYYVFAKREFDSVGRMEYVTAIVNPNYNRLGMYVQLANGSGYAQKNNGKISISLASAYAGSIELLVYGRY